MIINIEKRSGFCSGVFRVVSLADEILDKGEELFCLGQIVHNDLEVNRLISKGLKFIDDEGFRNLHNTRVLLRAHGEPPETYQIAKENNLEIIDGTCPIVKRIQHRIRKDGSGREQIIIYGKMEHPEVRGLKKQTEGNIEVIYSIEEARKIKLSDKVHLYSQTTMDHDKYGQIISIIAKRIDEQGGELIVNNTICGHVQHRKPGLVKFARENDVIIFIAGSNSSNGRMLFEICKTENSRCHYVTDHEQINREWFRDAKSVGISGATSTPRWQIDKAYSRIEELTSEK